MYLRVDRAVGGTSMADRDIRRISAYKGRSPRDRRSFGRVSAAVFGREQGTQQVIAEGAGGNWLCFSGCWVHRAGVRSDNASALLKRYEVVGVETLANELDGVFAIIIGDTEKDKIFVITDACGSLHMYLREDEDGLALSTSSLGISQTGALDPVAFHEFAATGIIYEQRSMWRGIKKIPPAAILEINLSNLETTDRPYWRFSSINAESLSLNEGVEALHSEMTRALKDIGQSYGNIVSDLTGGYDSRILLAGLLASGVNFHSTVSGPRGSGDVIVAHAIANRLGRKVVHSDPGIMRDAVTFEKAVRLTDGECDAFDTARILCTHLPASKVSDISLNGSFGELARGYWWELLWPQLGRMTPLDARMIARKRFAASPYDKTIFDGPSAFSLLDHMSEVANRSLADLRHLPNTSQMDGLYFRLRMQRWQGRIASTTNQIWPAISPLAFKTVLSPILAARAKTRFRSLLPRTMFARKTPSLAAIPLEHGYPPTRLGVDNLISFWPVVTYYGKKVYQRVQARLPGTGSAIPPLSPLERYQEIFSNTPLRDWLTSPLMFHKVSTNDGSVMSLFDPRQHIEGSRLEQWHRLVSVEFALRAWQSADEEARQKQG